MKKKVILGVIATTAILIGIFMNRSNADDVKFDENENNTQKMYEEAYEMGENDSDLQIDYLSTSNEIDENKIAERAKIVEGVYDDLEYDELYNNMLNEEKKSKALYIAAIEYGIKVEESEVDEVVEKIKESIEGTEEKSILDSYISGLEINEEEYWYIIRDKYKRDIYIKKYLEENKCEDEEIDKIAEEKINEYHVE